MKLENMRLAADLIYRHERLEEVLEVIKSGHVISIKLSLVESFGIDSRDVLYKQMKDLVEKELNRIEQTLETL